MNANRSRTFRAFTQFAFVLLLTAAAHADQGSALKTIDNPAGGHVIYGSIHNTYSMRDAMITMLRYVHHQFGDKPKIGRFFRTKGSDSVATFFQLNANSTNNLGQNAGPVGGMIIVSIPPGSTTAATAVLYDIGSRFAKTQAALMQQLNLTWQAGHPSQSSSSSEPSHDVGNQPGGIFGSNTPAKDLASEPLHLAIVSDNSGSIGLPEGWRIVGGGGGALVAHGPKGETMSMGVINQNIYDPGNSQNASMIAYMRKGTQPFFVCPYSSDLAADYLCVANQWRQQHRLPALSMRVISSRANPNNRYDQALLVERDDHDGKGILVCSIHAHAQLQGQSGWILMIDEINLPKPLARQEWPTAKAMIFTYRQNAAVIQGETQRVIDQINRTAEANRKIAQDKAKANYDHNRDVDAEWDAKAKENKAFENYTLDRAIVQDNDLNTHGTYDYPTADALVKSDPTRFQYVPTQEMVIGVDYF